MAHAWEALFDELVELDPAAQDVRLEEIRQHDSELAGLLNRLLKADQANATLAEPILGRSATLVGEALTGPPDPANAEIGSYRLLESLGAGGMAEVYRAERCDGEFEQHVAIKRIRSGAGSDAILDRFIRERQILARLHHPGIARLLDGGRDNNNQPFFVMELVDGEPITGWCRRHGVSVADRVRLVAEVADAVDAAHRSLVVHRDLKPSNILVDRSGRPRLLDFGIATILDAERDTALTDYEHRPFTPSYAAPEQILGEPITTGTDVWALGVLLFELLVDRLPFPDRGPHLPELMRSVGTESAPRPSAVAATSEDSGLRSRAKQLAGDLDAIVLTALDRDPRRRYRSAAALADDLRRYLSGAPVEARTPTRFYRLRKLIARHRIAAAAAVLVVASLVAGVGLARWQAQAAELEADRAETVTTLLIDLFRASDPSLSLSLGANLTAREILQEGATRVEANLATQPEILGRVLDAIAQVERRLGLTDAALQRTKRALALFEGDRQAQAPLRMTLAETLIDQGNYVQAQEQLELALAARPQLRKLVLRSGTGGFSRLDPMADRWYDASVRVAWGQFQLVAARALLDAALDQLDEAPDLQIEGALRRVQLAGIMADAGEMNAAAELATTAMPALREHSGDPLALADAQFLVGQVLDLSGTRDQATAWFRSGLTKLTEALGPDHPEVALREVSLGYILQGRGEREESERVLQHAYAILQPLGHPDAGAALRYLGFNDMARGAYQVGHDRFAEAEAFFATRPDQHHLAVAARLSRGWALLELHRLREAKALLATTVSELEAIEGTEGNSVRSALKYLGRVERELGDPAAALALHHRALEIERHAFGTDQHLGVASTKHQLALDYLDLGRLDEADLSIVDAIATLDHVAPGESRREEFLAAKDLIDAARPR